MGEEEEITEYPNLPKAIHLAGGVRRACFLHIDCNCHEVILELEDGGVVTMDENGCHVYPDNTQFKGLTSRK